MTLSEIWRRITCTRYSRELEAELADARSEIVLLRAENRGLLNSILGIAGVPPVLVSSTVAGAVQAGETLTEPARISARRPNGGGTGAKIAVPTRRRSWQQINRMLEFESGQKKRDE